MNKLLVICGPTATGKTKLAGYLAKKFNGELISADSRQVFKRMDIGTGKEYVKGVKIWGYDLVSPKKDFSISQYLTFANAKIEDISKRGKLPILVGGTGFYMKGVIEGFPTILVPQNHDLRKNLEGRSATELFELLAQVDSSRAGQMNSSDKKNPRRIVRAIEVATWRLEHGDTKPQIVSNLRSVLKIGLMAQKDFLNTKISQRVDRRVSLGIKKEIKELIRFGVDWNDQSMMALGYRQWRDYFEGGAPEDVVIDEWKKDERKYAKRQMTWFKKDKEINWFNVTSKNYKDEVENLVKKWYSKAHAKKD